MNSIHHPAPAVPRRRGILTRAGVAVAAFCRRADLARALLVLLTLAACSAAAQARVLEVGPGQPYDKPSAAAAAAQDGDTIRIAPGQYFDCAVLRQNNLTIEGSGAGAVLTDKICAGKALLVIDGNNVTVRNLTLQRARAPDRNGAGIRAEGGNLLIDHDRFINDENGILSAENPKATARILDSEFDSNGTCVASCGHGVYFGQFGLVHIERSRFTNTREGHSIKSRALRTEVINSTITDGPDGTSSYLIDIPNGGTTIITGNTLEKGPKSGNPAYAIAIGEEGVERPTEQILVQGNHFTNDTGRSTVFVRNLTATPAQLQGNVFKGEVRPLDGDGSVK